ncbi:hypothetical protein J2S41_006446 [Catenuloplanes atrovinosus]|uniref:Uncharacterized protein n=1 Tax=Catenuloplanes atrovinosus TaxID=137266 RepID=A0AAE3YTK2_9ACTN|nr:hypothetical protein [Catenuloplanes atrovinosus]
MTALSVVCAGGCGTPLPLPDRTVAGCLTELPVTLDCRLWCDALSALAALRWRLASHRRRGPRVRLDRPGWCALRPAALPCRGRAAAGCASPAGAASGRAAS